ncbi:hypothetical protein, partial [Enterobacter hormaechei]|uniref:hypothetical protein n=1 Tax=Enterobacter hormaechei TaxID=158836 RepID=UPI001EF7E123
AGPRHHHHLLAQCDARRPFQGINFYEGQTFIVRTASGARKPADLENSSICVATGSSDERTASDYFREHNIKV